MHHVAQCLFLFFLHGIISCFISRLSFRIKTLAATASHPVFTIEGDLVTAGLIYDQQGSLGNPEETKDILFKNGAGTIVALITEEGDMALVGEVIENEDIED